MSCIEYFGYYENVVNFPEHRHTSCELLYLYDGELSVFCNGNEYELTSGMVYIIPSCILHKSFIKDSGKYRRHLLFLNPWTYCRTHYSDTIHNMLMGFSVNKPVVARDDFSCAELIFKIQRELNKGETLSEDIIISAVTEILVGIIRQADFINRKNKSPGKLVSQVREYIRENYGKRILISDIADKFYINKFYLTHIFKDQTGMSPRQFLTFTRLSKAYSLLHEPDMKISEISETCGFTSQSDMTKKFREQYNMTPTNFRKALTEKTEIL